MGFAKDDESPWAKGCVNTNSAMLRQRLADFRDRGMVDKAKNRIVYNPRRAGPRIMGTFPLDQIRSDAAHGVRG